MQARTTTLCACAVAAAAAMLLRVAAAGNVVCSVEEYVLAGMEFDKCQQQVLANFSKGNLEEPCPLLHHVAEVCANNVRFCFTDRGWNRGRKIFFDTLAVQFPEVNSCDIFKEGKAKAGAVSDLEGFDKCTVEEEIASGQDIGICSNDLQGKMVEAIIKERLKSTLPVPSDALRPDENKKIKKKLASESASSSTTEEEQLSVRGLRIMCDHLQTVKDTCIMRRLSDCYSGHDLDAHLAYLLESLKVSANVIAIHLTNITDIPSCPVFTSSAYLLEGSQAATVTILSASLGFILVLIVGVAAFIAGRKYRLLPRAKAWASNAPYADMIVAEATVGSTAAGNSVKPRDVEMSQA